MMEFLLTALLALSSSTATLSPALAQQVILGSKEAVQPLCTRVGNVLAERLPADFEMSARSDPFFKDFQTLQRYGYVKITERQVINPYGGGKTNALHVELTPKYKADFGSTTPHDMCIGTWKAQKIVQFTAPTEANGTKYTTIKVRSVSNLTGWAKNADLRAALSIIDPPATTIKFYTLVYKDKRWQVGGVR